MIVATRRQVLKGAGLATLSLYLRGLSPRALLAETEKTSAVAGGRGGGPIPSYSGYQELYRQAWTWDRVVRGTHLRANCFSACGWDLYVKDGIVWREEQSDRYRRPDSPLPEYGPRGCQKGACYSSLMTSPDRLR